MPKFWSFTKGFLSCNIPPDVLPAPLQNAGEVNHSTREQDMGIEEQYEDVLQNIEYAIVSVYRGYPDISDKSVLGVLNETIDHFANEKRGIEPKGVFLSEPGQLMYDRVKEMCHFRLGRISKEDMPAVTAISVDEIIACLKRIRKSVKRWRKERGKQGYLTYVSNFIK